MKICVVATDGRSLTDFRGQLIKRLCNDGHQVICVSIESSEQMQQKLSELGAEYIQVAGDRVGIGIFSGLRMIKAYENMFRYVQPDCCFLYMSKPIAFGGYAATKAKVKNINILVNGLENAYYQHGIKDFVVRCVMSTFYRYVSAQATNVFMQNIDDYKYFLNHHIAKKSIMTVINGSGVDMDYFKREPLPDEPIFLMVARLLWTKGIREYLEAIKKVKQEVPQAKFMLVGGLDESDEGLSEEELKRCVSDYEIEYCGFTPDVRPYLKKCSVFVLPSYHEGTPRSVLEAMATGRVIITSDAPGCRETVENGKNGYLVPVGDSEALADSMIKLAQDSKLRNRMAERSYHLCCEKYEVNIVNSIMIEKMFEEK